MKSVLPQGLIYFGWFAFIVSAICALMAFPLFIMELKEPISSGNEGATGMGLLVCWGLYLTGLSFIVLGKLIGKKPYLKFAKYGAAIFVGQLAIILLFSFLFPDSKEWIWKF